MFNHSNFLRPCLWLGSLELGYGSGPVSGLDRLLLLWFQVKFPDAPMGSAPGCNRLLYGSKLLRVEIVGG